MTYYIEDEKLFFEGACNSPFTEEELSAMKRVKEVHLNFVFDADTSEIPDNIKKIVFGHFFNQPISKENLPKSIECIDLGFDFNHPINNLPDTLKKLKLSWNFNYELDNLPVGLEDLTIGSQFNHPLNFLPGGLKILKFSCVSDYFYPLDNLPNTIYKMEISMNYPGEINNLPDSIEELRIGVQRVKKENRYVLENTPNHGFVKFYKRIERFPSNLKKLYIFENYHYINDLQRKLGDKLIVIKIS